MANIVLTCIGNFQEYIKTNIIQLQKLGHKQIFILTNNIFFKEFNNFKDITLIDVDTLYESYQFYSNSNLDKSFRNGFWTLTSLRFFYIYEFMKTYNINDVIHLENDVLIYYNCDCIINCFDKSYMYVPFDTFTRNIASIIYIPDSDIFKKILDNYNYNLNDMANFSIIKQQTGLIRNLPIFPTNNTSEEHTFVTQNFNYFNGFIFDAAAMGQYIAGGDSGKIETSGFVNETCIIKYNNYQFVWEINHDIKRPFLITENSKIPIFNLHIHRKNLEKYI